MICPLSELTALHSAFFCQPPVKVQSKHVHLLATSGIHDLLCCAHVARKVVTGDCVLRADSRIRLITV